MTDFIQSKKTEGRFGCIGRIVLNRPEALNALNLEMIQALHSILKTWENDPTVLAVIVESASEKAFCAGGDIRALYEAGLRQESDVFLDFFKQEYALDAYTHHYKKPYISFLNGITMGGGVGISLHGSHRVAGENFRFAMPETAIGFFPDIGGSHLLNQCPGAFGMYLGLTGARVGQADAQALNLVDYCINKAEQAGMIAQLHDIDLREMAHEKVSACLQPYHQSTTQALIFDRLPWVNTVFSLPSVEAIFQALEAIDLVMLADLKAKSPLSLKITHELINRMRDLSLDACLAMDTVLVAHFSRDKDFFEGVRALIIDKDNKPQWQPAVLSDITKNRVESYFSA